MKGFIDKIINNGTQIIEIILLTCCFVAPFAVNAAGLFSEYVAKTTPDPENVLAYLIVRAGNKAMAIALLFFVLWRVRAHNKDFLMNRGNAYHQYPYAWYWFCANILGIRKCNLVRVPIYMQFKLVIKGTFTDYPLDESAYPVAENEADACTSVINEEVHDKEVNLILEDTYCVEPQQISRIKQELRTMKVSRNNDSNKERHFSQKFIDAVINTVRDLDQNSIVNIYATTNPMNTKHIASRAVALADRGNIQHLYVYQQKNSDDRMFETKGYKIF